MAQMATVLSTLRHKTMRLIDFGRIEKLARDAKHEYQELEQKIETIEEEDGTEVVDSTSVSASQQRLKSILAEIEAETEHVSLGTHELTRSTTWNPSRSAFSMEREDGTVEIRAEEEIPSGKDVTVLRDGSEIDNPFDDGAVDGDTMTVEDVTDDIDVTVEWESVEKREETLELPNGYSKNISNDSLIGLPYPPSREQTERTYSKTNSASGGGAE